ncbi:MAG: thioredoxin family protein [Planctomycetaceae bacterium]|nr:thioredoxin family protein [Planctomycetaceae bacterium]
MRDIAVKSITTMLLLLAVSTLNAGEYNEVLDIGDTAPQWKDLPGVDGKKHSLKDLKDKDVVVVVFTCNSCPYANDIEKRLDEFVKKHKDDKVALVAINVNKVEEDQFPAMKKRAKDKKYKYPYLYDETQQIAKDYGALFTPEFFVLDKKRKVVYMGSMDDSPDGKKIKKRHVEDAVTASLKGGNPKVEETIAIGCLIRFERKRRRRKSE